MRLIKRIATTNIKDTQILQEAAKALVFPLIMNYKKNNLLLSKMVPSNTDILMSLDTKLLQVFNNFVSKKTNQPCQFTDNEVKQILNQYITPNDWLNYFKRASTNDKVEELTPRICKSFINIINRHKHFMSKNQLLQSLDTNDVTIFNDLLNKTLAGYIQSKIYVHDVNELKDILTDYIPGNWDDLLQSHKSKKNIKSLSDIRYIYSDHIYKQVITHISNTIKHDLNEILNFFNTREKRFINSLKEQHTFDRIRQRYISYYLNDRIEEILAAESKEANIHVNADQMTFTPQENKFINTQIQTAIEKYNLSEPNNTILSNMVHNNPQFAKSFNVACTHAFNTIFDKQFLLKFIRAKNIPEDYHKYLKIHYDDIFAYFFSTFKEEIIKELHLSDKTVNHKDFDIQLQTLAFTNRESIIPIFYKNINKLILPLTRLKLKHLKDDNSDKKGESHTLDIASFDQNNREKPFIILNKRFIMGHPGETHINIIERLKQMPPTKFYREHIFKLLHNKFDSLVFGHIVDNLAFLDIQGMQGDITPEFAIALTRKQPGITKVYTDINQGEITRLAKRAYPIFITRGLI